MHNKLINHFLILSNITKRTKREGHSPSYSPIKPEKKIKDHLNHKLKVRWDTMSFPY